MLKHPFSKPPYPIFSIFRIVYSKIEYFYDNDLNYLYPNQYFGTVLFFNTQYLSKMGVKNLSTFLTKSQKESVKVAHLSKFKGKTIVVDFTNQLYRFLYRSNKENSYLLEFINLIHKFQKYYINLIFVFDGKPADEKQYVINHRKEYRDKLIKKIEDITENLTENSDSSDESLETITYLTKKTNTVKNTYIVKCKDLFDILCIPYIHVENVEADTIFRYLLDNNYADACFSGDMDLLAYGCHTILKDLDYRNDTVQHIDYNSLLNELGISPDEFIFTCILSGTDYNNSLKRSKFEINLELIKKYKTINDVINNLDEINYTLPEEFHKSLPKRFDWEKTYKFFTETLSLKTQEQIIKSMDNFIGNGDIKCKNAKYTQQLTKYLSTEIKPFDDNYKYMKKVKEFIKWKYNLTLLC